MSNSPHIMIPSHRINWEAVTADFINYMAGRGYKTLYARDAEGVRQQGTTAELASCACCCDEGYLRMQGADGDGYTVFIVLGNAPHELVCDFSYPKEMEHPDAFDAATMAWYELIEKLDESHWYRPE